MCIVTSAGAVIAVNSHSTYGRQRFTLAHELYHVFHETSSSMTVCANTIEGKKDIIEKKADMFASYLLLPDESLRAKVFQYGESLAIEFVVDLEQQYGLSHQAMLFRLYSDHFITCEEFEAFRTMPVSRIARERDYDPSLYQRLALDDQYGTNGHYITKATELLHKGFVSDGKYDELMLDIFREDLLVSEIDSDHLEELYD